MPGANCGRVATDPSSCGGCFPAHGPLGLWFRAGCKQQAPEGGSKVPNASTLELQMGEVGGVCGVPHQAIPMWYQFWGPLRAVASCLPSSWLLSAVALAPLYLRVSSGGCGGIRLEFLVFTKRWSLYFAPETTVRSLRQFGRVHWVFACSVWLSTMCRKRFASLPPCLCRYPTQPPLKRAFFSEDPGVPLTAVMSVTSRL